MNETDLARTNRRASSGDPDRGSAVGLAIGVLSAILLGLLVFVAFKYMGSDENAAAKPSTTILVTAATGPSPSEEPPPSPTPPAVVTLDGTWTGHVTGDLNAYDIEVVIVDDGADLTGDVTYPWNPARPGVDECVGEWTQTHRSGDQVDVHEVITSGDACIDELDVTLDLKSNGTIAYASFYGDGTYLPTATLTRED